MYAVPHPCAVVPARVHTYQRPIAQGNKCAACSRSVVKHTHTHKHTTNPSIKPHQTATRSRVAAGRQQQMNRLEFGVRRMHNKCAFYPQQSGRRGKQGSRRPVKHGVVGVIINKRTDGASGSICHYILYCEHKHTQSYHNQTLRTPPPSHIFDSPLCPQ